MHGACNSVGWWIVVLWESSFSIIAEATVVYIHQFSIPIDTFQHTDSTRGTAAKWTIVATVRVQRQTLWFTHDYHVHVYMCTITMLCSSSGAATLFVVWCKVRYANNVSDCLKNWTSSFYACFSLNTNAKIVTRQPDAMICFAGF